MPDRLSALDAAFLDLDTAAAPLHVGWTLRLEGRPPSLAGLRRHLASRLERVPRFRCRVAGSPRPGGGRRWVEDRGFDIARHVHALALPAPGGLTELRAAAGTLLSTRLDPSRPLWRMNLVSGLAGGGFALVGQAHHALVDGIAAMEVAALLLDAEEPPEGWASVAAPPERYGGSEVVRASSRPPWRGLPHPAAALGLLQAAGSGAGSLLRPAPETGLDRTAGHRRAVGFAEAGLEPVREAGRRRGGTINDVLLAASTVALGEALRRRGTPPQELKAMVPVSVRREGEDGGLGNRISFVFVRLPLRARGPEQAFAAIRAQTAAAKSGDHAAPLDVLTRGAGALPASARRMLAVAATRAVPFNVVVSNVPGPAFPLTLLGRRVTAAFPAVPVLDGRSLTIGALSWSGRLCIGIYADAEVVPDTVEIARDLESALDALRADRPDPVAPRADTPWRRRAQARRLRAASR